MQATNAGVLLVDVDGTLVDSERDGHRRAFNLAFAEADLPYEWNEESYGVLLTTTGGRQRIERFLLGAGHRPADAAKLARQLHLRKTELFAEIVCAGGVAARPGAVEFCDAALVVGLRLVVTTTGTRTWVEPLLDRIAPGRFEALVTGTEVSSLKPDPAVFLHALDLLGLPTAAAVAIEDSANGLRAARAAEVPCIIVVNDYTAHQEFAGAAAVTDSFGPDARVLAGPPAAVVGGVLDPRFAMALLAG